MGFIDKTVVSISCVNCTSSENINSREKGSNRGTPYWTEFSLAKKFRVVSVYDDLTGPKVQTAKCLKCDSSAQWEVLSN